MNTNNNINGVNFFTIPNWNFQPNNHQPMDNDNNMIWTPPPLNNHQPLDLLPLDWDEEYIKNLKPEELDKISKQDSQFLMKRFDHCRETILMVACKVGNLELIKYLTKNTDKNFINEHDVQHRTAIHYAVESSIGRSDSLSTCFNKINEKAFECLELLLDAGANPNYYGLYMGTPLYDAIHKEADTINITELRNGQGGYSAMTKEFEATHTIHRDHKIAPDNIIDLLLDYSAVSINEDGEKDETELNNYQEKRFIEQWHKTRLLLIGNKDQNSVFFNIPNELITEISKRTFLAL